MPLSHTHCRRRRDDARADAALQRHDQHHGDAAATLAATAGRVEGLLGATLAAARRRPAAAVLLAAAALLGAAALSRRAGRHGDMARAGTRSDAGAAVPPAANRRRAWPALRRGAALALTAAWRLRPPGLAPMLVTALLGDLALKRHRGGGAPRAHDLPLQDPSPTCLRPDPP